jgi:hypothetical protein
MTKPQLAAVGPADDDDQIVVDMISLTVGEIEEIERLSDLPITHALDPDKPKGRIMRAVGCVVRKRTDPGFTWEQAADLRVFFGADRQVPPTRGRGSSTKSRSRSTSTS